MDKWQYPLIKKWQKVQGSIVLSVDKATAIGQALEALGKLMDVSRPYATWEKLLEEYLWISPGSEVLLCPSTVLPNPESLTWFRVGVLVVPGGQKYAEHQPHCYKTHVFHLAPDFVSDYHSRKLVLQYKTYCALAILATDQVGPLDAKSGIGHEFFDTVKGSGYPLQVSSALPYAGNETVSMGEVSQAIWICSALSNVDWLDMNEPEIEEIDSADYAALWGSRVLSYLIAHEQYGFFVTRQWIGTELFVLMPLSFSYAYDSLPAKPYHKYYIAPIATTANVVMNFGLESPVLLGECEDYVKTKFSSG